MGFKITKTRQPYGSPSINATVSRGTFNRAALSVNLTPPERSSKLFPQGKTESELAVEAQSKGIAGNFKNATGEILAEIRRKR